MIAGMDHSRKAKAAALNILVQQNDKKYIPMFTKLTRDSSYTVAGTALAGLFSIDAENAFKIAKELSADAKGDLGFVVMNALLASADTTNFKNIIEIYSTYPPRQEKLGLTEKLGNYLGKLNNDDEVKQGVQKMLSYRKQIPVQYRNMTDEVFRQTFQKLIAQLKVEGRKQVADYVETVIL